MEGMCGLYSTSPCCTAGTNTEWGNIAFRPGLKGATDPEQHLCKRQSHRSHAEAAWRRVFFSNMADLGLKRADVSNTRVQRTYPDTNWPGCHEVLTQSVQIPGKVLRSFEISSNSTIRQIKIHKINWIRKLTDVFFLKFTEHLVVDIPLFFLFTAVVPKCHYFMQNTSWF